MDARIDIRISLASRESHGIPEPVPNVLFDLLEDVGHLGNLSAAARSRGVSYRKAWNLVSQWSKDFGQPLLHATKGRGATLSELGEKLVWARRYAENQSAGQRDAIAMHISESLGPAIAMQTEKSISIAASHCLSHEVFTHLCHGQTGAEVGIEILGSGDSLKQLQARRCDAAGFHLVDGALSEAFIPTYRRYINSAAISLIKSHRRRQGLIVPRGNPAGLRGVSDLAQPGIRMINRQPNSGTRILFDRLLADTELDGEALAGYNNEENTHSAVCAAIAGGRAGVGLGTEAAAALFGLDFVPVASETYYYAFHAGDEGRDIARILAAVLQSAAWRRAVDEIDGYDASVAGEIIENAAELLGPVT